MVNKELIDLCRTVVGAIQETDAFSAEQLRKLLIHIVPQLLAELDILANVLESVLSQRMPVSPEPPSLPEPEKPKKRKKRRGRK